MQEKIREHQRKKESGEALTLQNLLVDCFTGDGKVDIEETSTASWVNIASGVTVSVFNRTRTRRCYGRGCGSWSAGRCLVGT